MSGAGGKGRAMVHLLQLAFRLLIVLLLVVAGIFVYLEKRTDSIRFHDSLRADLQAGLSAPELALRGGRRSQGQLELSRLAAEGRNETFFTSLEARNVRLKMGLLDGLAGLWQPGLISIGKLDVDLRAGADDAQSAEKVADALFRKRDKIEITAFEVADATLRWGYSERTEGGIESSALNMQRTDAGWRLSFKGGIFHQNWLSRLEIVTLVVVCTPDGLVVEKADLKQGDSTVSFPGLRLTGGERPMVEGVVKIHHLPLHEVLPSSASRFVEGWFSGDFRVFGSTNSADGVGFEGQVILDGKDVITLREQIYLLKALSVVDYSRNYHRVDFREGSFQVKTLHSGMELSDVKLKSEELFTMEGKMSVRLPTQEEIQAAMAQGSTVESSPLFAGAELANQGNEAAKVETSFTLKRAAQEALRVKEGTQSTESLSLFDRLALSMEMRHLQAQASDRMSRMLRYNGMFRITIPGDAFERGPKLQQRYPIDTTIGRIPMEVPIDGYLYELTLKQAEETYQLGKR